MPTKKPKLKKSVLRGLDATTTSTGGMTHKQHKDKNVKLPPKR